MTYRFTATEVRFVEESFAGASRPILAGGFASGADADFTPYLILQRSMGEDEEGFEGPYVEWCGQGNCCYDCIASFVLLRDRVKIVFSESAKLKVNEGGSESLEELEIGFKLNNDEFARLRSQLSEIIFKGRECFSYAATSV